MTKEVYRGIICKYEVYSGAEVLSSCFENAHNLYNFVLYCALGYNRKLAKARGDYSLAGKLPKYPGAIGMYNAMKNDELYKALSERVSSYIIRGIDSSIRSWFSNIKTNPRMRPPRYLRSDERPPITFEVGNGSKYINNGYWKLTALPKSIEDRHVIIKLHLPPLTNPSRVESIVILGDGRCSVSYKLRVKNNSGNSFAAIDLGVSRIATMVFDDGVSIMYHGGEILSQYHYASKMSSKCKPSGYSGHGFQGRAMPSDHGKRLWSISSKKIDRMLHGISASIVSECRDRGVTTIVIGDLTGIRKDKDYGSATNQKIHSWPFKKLTDMIEYKAEEVGIELVKVKEHYTSQTCAICGNRDKNARIERGLYACRVCGARIHADVNGAANILKKYLPTFEFGVAGDLSALPSPTDSASGHGKVVKQIDPTFVAKIDLRDNSVHLQRCNG